MSVGTAESLDFRLAGRLAGRLTGRVESAGLPSVAQVVSWMDLVELCRELDESLVAAEPPFEDALAVHGAVVSQAIGCGERLIRQIRSSGADISASGQDLDTLEASLELLRIFQRSQHPEFPPDEIEAARRRIFNAPA